MSELKPGDRIHCKGCGAPQGLWPDTPVPDHCGKCPPYPCEGCGKLCVSADMCCAIQLKDMCLADIKALFASSDLSLGGLGDEGQQ